MKHEKLDGIGSIFGGEYDEISVEGIGKLKGDAKAKTVTIEGLFKGKGRLNAEKLVIDGLARQFHDIKAGQVEITGVLKLRGASLAAKSINCNGVLVCTDEVNADQVYISGLASISKLFGDQIEVRHRHDAITTEKLPKIGKSFSHLYFGRSFSTDKSKIDLIECTQLKASGIACDIIRANAVELSDYCVVHTLYCDGDIQIDDTCRVEKIIKDQQTIVLNQPTQSEKSAHDPDDSDRQGVQQEVSKASQSDRESSSQTTKKEVQTMIKDQMIQIMEKYKANTLNTDEAVTMLEVLFAKQTREDNQVGGSHDAPDTNWPDDQKIRAVVYRGRQILRKGSPDALKVTAELTGAVASVECAGNLSCKTIEGKTSAGGNVTCERIDGPVSCGGNVYSKKIDGSVKAGGGVHLGHD